jgi:hypothetical protein
MAGDDVAQVRVFSRGLAYHEIAMIKRMRLMSHPRDYIFSFLLRPGRKLTPACISEVEAGKIGAEVEPATERELEVFVARRLAEASDPGDYYGPLSSFQINEALGWFTRAQGDLLRDETQQVEFKIGALSGPDALVDYSKTMAAFSNNVGGYIFFGITDKRVPVGVDPSDFLSFDWDRLSALCRENFQPDIKWDRTLAVWHGKQLGVIYTYKATQKPVVAARTKHGIQIGSIYYRYRGHNEVIRPGDLFNMLNERDQQVREANKSSETQGRAGLRSA